MKTKPTLKLKKNAVPGMVSLVMLLLTSLNSYSAEIIWNQRSEGSSIATADMLIVDGDFGSLNTGAFTDVRSHGYIRFGLGQLPAMDYIVTTTSPITIDVNLTITPYSDAGSALTPFNYTLTAEYANHGNAGITIDADDYRMTGVHKFRVQVTGVTVSGSLPVPNFAYIEAGVYVERYYALSATLPALTHNYISFASNGSETVATNQGTTATSGSTNELELVWDTIRGAEYYDVEWTWVDNYSETDLSTTIAKNQRGLTEQEFMRNSTRIRTRDTSYRIPQVFAKGYLVYRVRAVGRWLDDPRIDKYGGWSSDGSPKTTVNDWPDVIQIGVAHQGEKNWQYQATYAEDGKKKEVAQYFDGTLRNRQMVTRINSQNQSVAAETIYDNEGRPVIQVLPVPQDNPAITYYPGLTTNVADNPYSHKDFDWEDEEEGCSREAAAAMGEDTGAAYYYSPNGHVGDNSIHQYVPDADGYPFTQVEYTPDNTGRIRNQSGLGPTHQIGGGHETMYYYLQPAQEELDRLFGYKVGYKQRYKKNMIVDANGQVSVSYLDAQGRVIATALAGDNPENLAGLPSETGPQHAQITVDLLNKQDTADVDTPLDDNVRWSTGRFGTLEDALKIEMQIGLPMGDIYQFVYTAESGVYEAACGETTASYPFVYDVTLSLRDDCGTEYFTHTYSALGAEDIGGVTGDDINLTEIDTLGQGSYTLYKEIRVNEAALEAYRQHFISSAAACILDSTIFLEDVDEECEFTCQECVEELGNLENFLAESALSEGHALSTEETTAYTALYDEMLKNCVEPCKPLTSCDVYREAMLSDLRPGGQYGGFSPNDPLSIFNVSIDNQLTGDWKVPVGGYRDEAGNPDFVTVQYDGTSYTPELDGIDPAAANDNLPGTYEVAPEDLLNVEDFIDLFNQSWSEALITYHPEYKLYEYAMEICNETTTVTATSTTTSDPFAISSELFDQLIRQSNTYDEARATEITLNGLDFYEVDLLQSGDLDNIDPFFNFAYGIHNTCYPGNGTTLKNNLMAWAMTDYENSGLTLLQYAAKTVLCGNDYNGSCTGFSTLNWAGMTSHPQKDEIWQTYKSYYLSYKSKIYQLFMDLYGFNQHIYATFPITGGTVTLDCGIFNGAIGLGGTSTGIAPAFADDATNFSGSAPSVMDAVNDLYMRSATPYYYGPIGLSGTIYDTKQARITRVDALYNPLLPENVIIEELSEEAGFASWSATGLCPAMSDMEALLETLGTEGTLTTTTDMDVLPQLTARLYEIFTGSAPGGSSAMTVTGTYSTNLQLDFDPGPGASTIITIPPIDGSLPWSTYGSAWRIYGVYHSYPVPLSTDFQVIVLAGASLSTSREYVVTIDCPVDLNACATDYTAQLGTDPDCDREEQFEAAMLALMKRLDLEGDLFTTNVDISTYPEYTQSILFEYMAGETPMYWNGPNINNVMGISGAAYGFTFDITGTFPNPLNDVLSFDIIGNDLYISVLDTITGNLIQRQAVFTYQEDRVKPAELDFTCPCELEPNKEEAVLNFFNYLIQRGDTTWTPGLNPDALEDLRPYLGGQSNAAYVDYEIGDEALTGMIVVGVENTCPFELELSETSGGDINQVTNIVFTSENTFNCLVYFSEGDSVLATGQIDCLQDSLAVCDDCGPQIEPPVSCHDSYEAYVAEMETRFLDALGAADTIFIDEYMVPNDSVFCADGYAYIEEAYHHYLHELNITDWAHIHFLTIAQFGATPIGYSNDKLINVVDDFVADTTSLSWLEYIQQIWLPAHPEFCPSLSPPAGFPDTITPYPCNQWENTVANVNQQNQNGIYVDQILASFTEDYVREAINTLVETFESTHFDKEYHYTLYYYDRAGNLVQTVPPEGVERLEAGGTGTMDYDEIEGVRAGDPEETATTVSSEKAAPDQVLETIYSYNSLNQLVYQKTPDGGESRFAYDALGRIVASQSAEQAPDQRFSYTCYDDLGRVVEAGEFTNETGTDFLITESGILVEDPGSPVVPVNTPMWIDAISNLTRTQVTHSIYDELKIGGDDVTVPIAGGGTVPVKVLFGDNYGQGATRNRITAAYYQETYDADPNVYTSATFYDYDIHGNVQHLLQVNNDAFLIEQNLHVKHVEYEYDLVSGNVNRVWYQRGKQDQFIYRYQYDADNRITLAETSEDGVYFERDAEYEYYNHGPLARTELGNKEVQGQDYMYTIHGWIKGVNSNTLYADRDPGLDNDPGSSNEQVANDAYSYSLDYYNGDYKSVGFGTSTSAFANQSGTSFQFYGRDLHNGNISQMFTTITDPNTGDVLPMGNNYVYDQLQRLKEGWSYTNINLAANAWTSGGSSKHGFNYSYDANGNIASQTRYNESESALIDQQVYHYHLNGGRKISNRLYSIKDYALSGTSADDIDDMEPSGWDDSDPGINVNNNYSYDESGRLVKDLQSGIANITWTVQNKVKQIVKSGKTITFDYDAMGHRIAKTVVDGTTTYRTWYVLDAQGNPLSIYQGEQEDSDPFIVYLAERNLYGSSRLGAEYLVNDTMNHDPLLEYLPLDPIETISLGSLCTTTGEWYYEVPNTSGALSDANTDGYDDITFTCTNSDLVTYGTGFSMQVGVDVVEGQTYTLDFEYLDETNLEFLSVEARDCSAGTVLLNDIVTVGHVAKTFTVPYGCEKVRIKWLAERANPAIAGDVTISKILIQGEGTEFGAFAPDTAYEVEHLLGRKRYELNNHLGNVLSVISDRKLTENVDTLLYSNDFNSGVYSGFLTDPGVSLSIVGDRLKASNLPHNYCFRRSLNSITTTGHRYRVRFTVDLNSSGPIHVYTAIGGTIFGSKVCSSNGTYEFEYAPTGTTFTSLYLRFDSPNSASNPRDFYIDDLSIEDITAEGYLADVLQSQDYSPFGVVLDGRHFTVGDDYRYGYQGSEKDDEIRGEGNSYTTYYRLLDPRIGRWLSTDPVTQPWQSPYCSMDNNPVNLKDTKGDISEKEEKQLQRRLKRLERRSERLSNWEKRWAERVAKQFDDAIVVETKDHNGNKRYNVWASMNDEDEGYTPGLISCRKFSSQFYQLNQEQNAAKDKLFGFYYEVGDVIGIQISTGVEVYVFGGASYSLDLTMVGGEKVFGYTVGGGLGLGAGVGADAQKIVCTVPGRYRAEDVQNGTGFEFSVAIGPIGYTQSGDFVDGEGQSFKWDGVTMTGYGGTLSFHEFGAKQWSAFYELVFRSINATKLKADVKYEWTTSGIYIR